MEKIKKKILIISLSYIAIILCLVVFLIYPSLSAIKDGSMALSSIKEAIALSNDELAELKDFQKKYPKMEEDFNRIDSLFFTPQSPLGFIQFIEEISSESMVVPEISLPQNVYRQNDNSAVTPIGLQVKARGSFSNLMLFSKKIESEKYLIKIQNLDIKKIRTDKSQSDNLYEAVFSLKVLAN